MPPRFLCATARRAAPCREERVTVLVSALTPTTSRRIFDPRERARADFPDAQVAKRSLEISRATTTIPVIAGAFLYLTRFARRDAAKSSCEYAPSTWHARPRRRLCFFIPALDITGHYAPL